MLIRPSRAMRKKVDQAMRSPYLEDLEEIGDAYEIQRRKATEGESSTELINAGLQCISWPSCACSSFYYDFLDRYVDRRDFRVLLYRH